MSKRETNPHAVMVQFPPETLSVLDELAEESALPGEKPNRSKLLRELIWAEYKRRKKSKKVSQST